MNKPIYKTVVTSPFRGNKKPIKVEVKDEKVKVKR